MDPWLFFLGSLYLLFITLGAPPSAWEADTSPPWRSSSSEEEKGNTEEAKRNTDLENVEMSGNKVKSAESAHGAGHL